jgi:hypothetical protein
MYKRTAHKPKMDIPMVFSPEYVTKKKPMMNNGMYCFFPITMIVIAKPNAGRILPAIAKPLVVQEGNSLT